MIFERLQCRFGFEFESNTVHTKAGAFYSHYKSKEIHHYKNKCIVACMQQTFI
jgi:hypothetical protein